MSYKSVDNFRAEPGLNFFTPQILNNFNFHYFIIIHSFPTLFYIIQKQNFKKNYFVFNIVEWFWHI